MILADAQVLYSGVQRRNPDCLRRAHRNIVGSPAYGKPDIAI